MIETAQILVRHDVDLKTFREEIVPACKPVVLKGLVKDWPAVRAARESTQALVNFVRSFDKGAQAPIIEGPPSIEGHLFYLEDMSALNFERRPGGISATLDRLLSHSSDANPPTIFIESMPTDRILPDFAAAHPMPLLPPDVGPRIWIGNFLKVQTHFDLYENIACVVGGRRRFTLFPPDQVANLYLGPFDFTPSGAAVSLVRLHDPDLARFPRFAEAMRHAVSAELAAGDALYIPYGWWHHVESLTSFNVLVNYWWNNTPKMGSPFAVLLHAALSLRDLPAEQREVWHAIFEHFVFTDPEQAMRHLPPLQRGLLGPPSAQRTKQIRGVLADSFTKS
jgi:hypothetical protein